MSRSPLSLLVFLGCLGVLSLPQTSAAELHEPGKPNFNGTWALDHEASASVEPLMREVGASLLERTYATMAGLKATFQQTEQVLTVSTRGLGFALDETLYLNGGTRQGNLSILGATAINTRADWSGDYKELVVTYQIRTKQGKEGHLVIKRYLVNDGKSMVVAFSLRLSEAPNRTSARQTWNKLM